MRLRLCLSSLVTLVLCHNKQYPLKSPALDIPLTLPYTFPIDQPHLGFGTWNLRESHSNTSDAVALAIQVGYRQIDAAAAYGNEKDVGTGIADGLRRTGLRRDEIWVTSKLWNDHHAPSRVEPALNKTLSNLGLDYLDLYLMHWPVGKGPNDESYKYDYISTWQAMEQLLQTGRVRYIGVSNFSPAQLEKLIQKTNIVPKVHQMELHPYLLQTAFISWHKALGMGVTAYSPLGNMNPTYGDRGRRERTTQSKRTLLLDNKVVRDIAEKRACTPAQVVLAWGVRRGTSVIPKSKHLEHIKENIRAPMCVLQEDEVAKLDTLGEQPTRFNNPSKAWGVRLYEGLEDSHYSL